MYTIDTDFAQCFALQWSGLSFFALLWCTVDVEIKVLSAETPELSKVPSLKPGVAEEIALHALCTARNVSFLPSVFNFTFTDKSQFFS